VIRLYGICDRPELPVPPPLEAVTAGGLQAVFAREDGPAGTPTPDELWAHERVVERLMEDRAVLPMRFGSTVADEQALRTLLREDEPRFAEMLGRVSGHIELAVRAFEAEPAAVAAEATTGRDYLLGKLRDDQRSEALHEPLAALASASERRPGRELLRGAYLVARESVPRFRAAVERLQEEHPELTVVCTGPWPPYSFVS
jgi:hypothetical protein